MNLPSKKRQRVFAIAALIGLSMVATSAGAAQAKGAPDAAIRIATQVTNAKSDSKATQWTEQSGEFVATSSGIKNQIARKNTSLVRVSGSNIGTTGVVEISLPTEFNSVAAQASDGMVVIGADTADQAPSMAVQSLTDGGTRVQTVIPNARAKHQFAYSMKGFTPTVGPDGSALFVSTAQNGYFVPVETPWAVDANGVNVPTHYEVRGSSLVQVVTPSTSVTYPIVADPTWRWISGGYGLKLSRTETSNVRNYGDAIAMCGVFARSANLAIYCGAWAGYMVTQANFAQSDRPQSCLFLNVIPAPGSIWRVTC